MGIDFITSPKTKAGYRRVSINGKLVDLLTEWRKKQQLRYTKEIEVAWTEDTAVVQTGTAQVRRAHFRVAEVGFLHSFYDINEKKTISISKAMANKKPATTAF